PLCPGCFPLSLRCSSASRFPVLVRQPCSYSLFFVSLKGPRIIPSRCLLRHAFFPSFLTIGIPPVLRDGTFQNTFSLSPPRVPYQKAKMDLEKGLSCLEPSQLVSFVRVVTRTVGLRSPIAKNPLSKFSTCPGISVAGSTVPNPVR